MNLLSFGKVVYICQLTFILFIEKYKEGYFIRSGVINKNIILYYIMSYNKIINPKNGKPVSIYGKKGNSILDGYFNYLIKNKGSSQRGGDPITVTTSPVVVNGGVSDAGEVLKNYWKTQKFIRIMENDKGYNKIKEPNRVTEAETKYDTLLKVGTNINNDASLGEKEFFINMIGELIKMCGGRMKLYKKTQGSQTHEEEIYNVEQFKTMFEKHNENEIQNEIQNGVESGAEEPINNIENYHILLTPRPVHDNFSFKAISSQITKMIDELKVVKDTLNPRAAEEPLVKAEVGLIDKLEEYLNNWFDHVARTGFQSNI